MGSLGVGEVGTSLDLLKRADSRLYEAKRGGRNRVVPTVRVGKPDLSESEAAFEGDADPSKEPSTTRLIEATGPRRQASPPTTVSLPKRPEKPCP